MLEQHLLLLLKIEQVSKQTSKHANLVAWRIGCRCTDIEVAIDLPVVCLTLDEVEQERILDTQLKANGWQIDPERLTLRIQFILAVRKRKPYLFYNHLQLSECLLRRVFPCHGLGCRRYWLLVLGEVFLLLTIFLY